MSANGWKGDAVDVVHMSDGEFTTIDNTRVLAAREAALMFRPMFTRSTNSFLPIFLSSVDLVTPKPGAMR